MKFFFVFSSGNIVSGCFIFRILLCGVGNEQSSQNWREEIKEERDTCHCYGPSTGPVALMMRTVHAIGQ